MPRKLVVIGNGMAAGRALDELLERAPGAFEVTIFGAEPRVNYDRIMLSPVVSGEKAYADILIHDEAWYARNRITLHRGKAVARIDRESRRVIAADGTSADYDALIVATGFPLTRRGEARTLHVATGHCRAGDELDLDRSRLADPKGTLALYMGRDSLPSLVRNLVAHGLSPDTPAVAIENGTLAHERRVFAPIRDLPEAAAALGRGPTLVIVGSVVRQAPGWSEASPSAAGAGDSLFERTLQAAA